MKNMSTKGFTLVEVLLIVLVIGLLAGAGYMVSQNYMQEDDLSQSEEAESEQEEAIDEEESNAKKKSFTGKEMDCNHEFTLSVPKDWHFGNIENGGNCYVATQEKLPAHGELSGEDISFVFNTSKTSLSLSEWVDEYFDERKDGEFSVTKTGQETIELHNGEKAVLATAHGGHSTSGNDKSMYFFHKKDSLGIFTSWDISTTDQELRDTAEEIVKTIN